MAICMHVLGEFGGPILGQRMGLPFPIPTQFGVWSLRGTKYVLTAFKKFDKKRPIPPLISSKNI